MLSRVNIKRDLMMERIHQFISITTSTLVLTISLVAASVSPVFAVAQGAAPTTINHLANDTYRFYLSGNRKLCISDNGANNQMTVETRNCADIKVSYIKGFFGWRFFTVFGHCVYADANNNKVEVTNGGCKKSHSVDLWIPIRNSAYKFNNGALTWT